MPANLSTALVLFSVHTVITAQGVVSLAGRSKFITHLLSFLGVEQPAYQPGGVGTGAPPATAH